MIGTPSAPVAPPPHVPAELIVDFDLYNMEGERDDFHLAWKRLQDSTDSGLVWTPHNEGHWIAAQGEDVHHIYADHVHFTSKVMLVPKSAGEALRVLPTMLDPPEHKPVRALINPHLSPKAVMAMECDIRAIAVNAIEGFRPTGGCDFIGDYAHLLPIAIFMKMVDLPMADVPRLKYWADELNLPTGAMTMTQIMAAFAGYLTPYIEARRQAPGGDMISAIVNGAVDGETLSTDDANQLLTQVLLGGLDTVASFLGFMMLFLAQNPGHLRQLLDDPRLIPAAVDEFLRRYPIVTNVRMVRADHVYKGIELRAGEMVALPTILHGLDDKQFRDPLEIDFHRAVGPTSTFGNGAHRCPGAFLARTELRITLEEWLARIPDFHVEAGHRVDMKGGIVGVIRKLPLRWS